MSAVEVIEQFKSLPPDEQVKQFVALREALQKQRDALKARLAEIEQVLGSSGPGSAEVDAECKKIADRVEASASSAPSSRYANDGEFQSAKEWVFKEHDELLRKLSQ